MTTREQGHRAGPRDRQEDHRGAWRRRSSFADRDGGGTSVTLIFACDSAGMRRRDAHAKRRNDRPAAHSTGADESWRSTFSSSTTSATSASWSPACWKTKAMTPAAPRDSDAALEAIARAPAERWCCSTSGCRASRLDGLELLDEIKRRDPSISGDDDLGPRQHRHRGRRRSGAARTTSSKSRSRPSGCCCWSSARPRPSGCGARMRALRAAVGARDRTHRQRRARSTRCARRSKRVAGDRQPRADHRRRPASARKSRRGCSMAGASAPTAPFVVVSCGADDARARRGGAVRRGGAAASCVRAGPARTGAWRHAVPRRDRRHADRDAGADPARADRAELRARRRHSARSRSMSASSRRPRAT